MMSQGRKVSIVIATLNRQEILCETLGYLLAQDYPDCEIIVVDQTAGVIPRLRRLLDEKAGRIHYIQLSTPSLTLARNAGTREASGEIVIFVDDDVVVGPEFVRSHVRNFREDAIGGVTGLTFNGPDGTLADALGTLEVLHNAVGPLHEGEVSDVNWLPGCNMSFRKNLLEEVGLFDEQFTGGAVCEDVDISLRIQLRGYRLVADTRIRLVHLVVPQGGCEIRNQDRAEEKAREAFRLSVYCWIKNRRSLGLWRLGWALYRSYRGYALNRPVLRQGLLWQRHRDGATEVAKALIRLREASRARQAGAAQPSV
jgi:GT2 family glycosyltransferase